jgi:hypothetical protein
MKYKKVTVFCAASKNCDKVYLEEAGKLGKFLAISGREIIYGGGNVGLMGSLANGCLRNAGTITGIIPDFLDALELAHKGITKLKVVKSLHERESSMLKNADCIIALPGGIGTFSELLQAITWKRLWQINSDIFIVNINGYFTPLIEMLNKAVNEKFLAKEFASLWKVVDSVDSLIIEFEKEKTIPIETIGIA